MLIHCLELLGNSKEKRAVAKEIIENVDQLPAGVQRKTIEDFIVAKNKWESNSNKKKFLVIHIPLDVSHESWPLPKKAEFSANCKGMLSLYQLCFANAPGFKGLVGYSREQGFKRFEERVDLSWYQYQGVRSPEGLNSRTGDTKKFTDVLTELRAYLRTKQSELGGEKVDLVVLANSSLNFKAECTKLWAVLKNWKSGKVIVDGTRACVFKNDNESGSLDRLSRILNNARNTKAREDEFIPYAAEPDFPVSIIHWNIPVMFDGSSFQSDWPFQGEAALLWGRPDIFNDIFNDIPIPNFSEFRMDNHDDYFSKVSEYFDSFNLIGRKLVYAGDRAAHPVNFLAAPSINWDTIMPSVKMIGGEDRKIYDLLAEAARSELKMQHSQIRQKSTGPSPQIVQTPAAVPNHAGNILKKYQIAKEAVFSLSLIHI